MKKVQRFRQEFAQVDLAKYFNLKPEITIKHTIEENIHLRIGYKKIDRCPYLQLPLELLREVQSYLVDTIELFLRIEFPLEYPFMGPIWTLLDLQHTLPLGSWQRECLYPYYRDKIHDHNQSYSLHWTPAITISNDLLDFIQKINHFEEILNL